MKRLLLAGLVSVCVAITVGLTIYFEIIPTSWFTKHSKINFINNSSVWTISSTRDTSIDKLLDNNNFWISPPYIYGRRRDEAGPPKSLLISVEDNPQREFDLLWSDQGIEPFIVSSVGVEEENGVVMIKIYLNPKAKTIPDSTKISAILDAQLARAIMQVIYGSDSKEKFDLLFNNPSAYKYFNVKI